MWMRASSSPQTQHLDEDTEIPREEPSRQTSRAPGEVDDDDDDLDSDSGSSAITDNS